jgi:hypothetical protein
MDTTAEAVCPAAGNVLRIAKRVIEEATAQDRCERHSTCYALPADLQREATSLDSTAAARVV